MEIEMEIISGVIISVAAAAIIAYIVYKLRQPTILGYIIAGIIIGPQLGLKLVTNPTAIDFSSELGLIALMFMVGLELDFGKIKNSGSVMLIASVAQFVICLGLGLLFFNIPGIIDGGRLAPLYLALTFSLSSTMIVVKILYDKFELDTLPGRLTLGILIIQDVWAIIFLAIQPSLADLSVGLLAVSFLKGGALVAAALLLAKFVLPRLFKSVAKNTELLVICALGWCFLVSWASADLAGLSRAMGALIAGISLSRLPYNREITDRVTSIRSFFLMLFFVSLGMKVTTPSLNIFIVSLIASLFLIASRFISLSPLLFFMKKGHRVSFLVPLNLAQISEFSLVIVAIGVGLGHVNQNVMTIILFTLMLTLTASTYMITYSYQLFLIVDKILHAIGIKDLHEQKDKAEEEKYHPIMILGCYKIASAMINTLAKTNPELKDKILVVDFNPDTFKRVNACGIRCEFGDIGNSGTLIEYGLERAKVVISSIPDTILKGTSNLSLLNLVKRNNPGARVVVTAENVAGAQKLYEVGADYVIVPHLEAAEKLISLLEKLTEEEGAAEICNECKLEIVERKAGQGD
jgi:Kef-type K+ transport system membrane component KefB/Trk K+ transport system NAD-binding subunit